MKTVLIFSIFAVSLATVSSQDNRCFLEKGGSSEIFFVSEAQEVGTVIGTLKLLGNIGGKGGISLRLNSKDGSTIPVEIRPGTKDLILTKALDKEGIKGPSSVSFSVVCDKKESTEQGLVIPVSIRVTDANDNYPEFANQPYKISVSEANPVGSVIFAGIKAFDADQPGPFSTVEYSIAGGMFAEFFEFPNSLDGSIFLRKPLDFETYQQMEVVIVAKDQGVPSLESRTTLYINVLDADDKNPAFTAPAYNIGLPDNVVVGQKLTVGPKSVEAFDQDVGINAPIRYILQNDDGFDKYLGINDTTRDIFVKRLIPDSAFIKPTTFVIKAMQADNPDRYALAPLSVSRGPDFNAPVQFLQKSYSLNVLENAPQNTTLAIVATNRPGDRRVKFYLSENANSQLFRVTPSGEILLSGELDYETQDVHLINLNATDMISYDTCSVEITVLNINDWDPTFRFGSYDFYVSRTEMLEKNVTVGTIEVFDNDMDEELVLELKGADSRFFSVTREGDVSVFDPSSVNVSTAYLVLTARDGGVPPRQSSVPVTVHFPLEMVARSQMTFSDSFLLPLILGSMLIAFGFVVAGLMTYICHTRRKGKRTPSVSPLVTQFERSPSEKARNQVIYAYPQRENNQESFYVERCQNPLAHCSPKDRPSSKLGSIPSSEQASDKTVSDELTDSRSIKSARQTTAELLPGHTQFDQWIGTVRGTKAGTSRFGQDQIERWNSSQTSFYGPIEQDRELDVKIHSQVRRTPSHSTSFKVSKMSVLY